MTTPIVRVPPTGVRSLLLCRRRGLIRPNQARKSYHSYEHAAPSSPFNRTEDAVLSASLRHVPMHGFTNATLSAGARDSGYLDVTVNFFPRGAFDLINYYLVSRRLALKHDGTVEAAEVAETGGRKVGVGAKVKRLTLQRLMANRPIIHRWQEALAIMAQPSNVSTSIAELARLSDEIWFLAGDTSVDSSWYTKRASLSAVYASTELFMTQDKSTDFADTRMFLDRRLEDVRFVGNGFSSLGSYLGFTAHSFVNVLRSKGVRI